MRTQKEVKDELKKLEDQMEVLDDERMEVEDRMTPVLDQQAELAQELREVRIAQTRGKRKWPIQLTVQAAVDELHVEDVLYTLGLTDEEVDEIVNNLFQMDCIGDLNMEISEDLEIKFI